MPEVDQRYLPQPKKKKKVAKKKYVAPAPSFPVPAKRIETKAPKKASSLNDKHVWSS